jgi:hypothetical protein
MTDQSSCGFKTLEPLEIRARFFVSLARGLAGTVELADSIEQRVGAWRRKSRLRA